MLFFGIDHLIHSHLDGKMMEYIMINGYWLVISNMKCIFHNIWDNPSQLTFIFFGGIETTNQHDFRHVVNIKKDIAICHGITDTGSIYFWESNVMNPIMMPGTVAYHPKWWYQDWFITGENPQCHGLYPPERSLQLRKQMVFFLLVPVFRMYRLDVNPALLCLPVGGNNFDHW